MNGMLKKDLLNLGNPKLDEYIVDLVKTRSIKPLGEEELELKIKKTAELILNICECAGVSLSEIFPFLEEIDSDKGHQENFSHFRRGQKVEHLNIGIEETDKGDYILCRILKNKTPNF